MIKPRCRYGYTEEQVRTIMGDRMEAFNKWFYGQTGTICEGREYSHELEKYVPTGCGPHGYVVYPWDVERFLGGKVPLD